MVLNYICALIKKRFSKSRKLYIIEGLNGMDEKSYLALHSFYVTIYGINDGYPGFRYGNHLFYNNSLCELKIHCKTGKVSLLDLKSLLV